MEIRVILFALVIPSFLIYCCPQERAQEKRVAQQHSSGNKHISSRYITKNGKPRRINRRDINTDHPRVRAEKFPGCGAEPLTLNAYQGVLRFPNHPRLDYSNNMHCEWNIVAETNKIILIKFESFSLEKPASSGKCYDVLAIIDRTRISVYCGDIIPVDYESEENILTLTFHSDESRTSSGFLIKYKTINKTKGSLPTNTECGVPDITPTNRRIVGGTPAIPNSWPWQIALLFKTGSGWRQGCGGSIIASRWILTAAHCVYLSLPHEIKITVGEHDLSTVSNVEKIMKVGRVIWHEEYRNDSLYHDIALLQLRDNIQFNRYIKPVCLPERKVPDNTSLFTTGWGRTDGTGDENILHQLKLEVVPRKKCRKLMVNVGYISNDMICAGAFKEGGKGSCYGDSGGPLVWGHSHNDVTVWNLQGVVSFGAGGCAIPNTPVVYTAVYNYVDWIKKNIQNFK